MSLRRWAYKHGIRWHAQNLNERRGLADGPMWQYGRAWITLFRGDGESGVGFRDVLEINPEWHFKPERRAGIGIQLGGGDGDRDIQFNLDLGLGRVYLTLDSPVWKSWLERILPGYWIDRELLHSNGQYRVDGPGPGRLKITNEVEVGIKWHDGGLWWSVWQTTMEWKSGTPKWRSGHFDPADWLLGRHVHSERDISTETVDVPMPEKPYPATVRLFESTWRRPRWPFARTLVRADIEVEGGIPHPGKGENSWDCGDDATYSLTCPARTAEDAVGKMVASVLRHRRRYGGQNWRPREAVA